MKFSKFMKTNFEVGVGGLGRWVRVWLGLLVATAGWSAEPTFYESKSAFVAALQNAQVVTQDFSGFTSGQSLSGVSLLPGVSATSTFANLVEWYSGMMFGYDGSTRQAGNGCYIFNLTNYFAVGFDIMGWDPRAPGPATAIVFLADGSSNQVQRWQTGPTESTPVFFGVIAEQNIVRVEWHEGPEVYGTGNEEVGVDNLICGRAGAPAVTLAGTWEPDVYTGHAVRLAIRQSDSDWFVHGWGACVPICDWGEVALQRITPHNTGAFDGWFAVWEFDFKKTYLWLTFNGQSLKAESMDIFTDGSGRQPYSILSWMHAVSTPALKAASGATNGVVRLQVDPSSGVKLQRCTNLQCADWVTVQPTEGSSEISVRADGSQGFFRLVRE